MTKKIVQITQTNTPDYFDGHIIDDLFQAIHQELVKSMRVLSKNGIGCLRFSEIPIKRLGLMDVYIEYNYEIVSAKSASYDILIHPHDVKIFTGNPPVITNRMLEISDMIAARAQAN